MSREVYCIKTFPVNNNWRRMAPHNVLPPQKDNIYSVISTVHVDGEDCFLLEEYRYPMARAINGEIEVGLIAFETEYFADVPPALQEQIEASIQEPAHV
jgi:hypothetical protein